MWTARMLAAPLPSILPSVSCGAVYDLLIERVGQPAIAVAGEGGEVLGLVNRFKFLARYAQRHASALFDREPITALMDSAPLVVDEGLAIADLGAMVAIERPEALLDCFVVTAEGRYLGIGTGEALMRSKVELSVAQEQRLKEALLAADLASQTKSAFLALMSHELRTPLNAVIGFAEILLAELYGPLGDARYAGYATDIRDAGRHLLALINDILDLSKAEAGKLEMQLEPVDIPELVRGCLRLVNERAQDQGLALSTGVTAAVPLLLADELRLKQILINLLSNAIKFTPAGGRVHVSAWVDERGGLVLSVADTGIGMAPESIPLALEPFRQLDSALGRKFEGTGLGLTLVKSLTELHGGTLAIDSALGRGTTVRLRFPPDNVLQDRAA